MKTGYAVKPIAGRCGDNIDLINQHEELLDKTHGNFAEQKNVLPRIMVFTKGRG
nr:hypothetical protein [Budvicia aquatica]